MTFRGISDLSFLLVIILGPDNTRPVEPDPGLGRPVLPLSKLPRVIRQSHHKVETQNTSQLSERALPQFPEFAPQLGRHHPSLYVDSY